MNILGKLFSSDALVKVMRLFLMNPDEAFDSADIVDRCRIKTESARIEIQLLKSIGFLKPKTFVKHVMTPGRGKDAEPTYRRKRTRGWMLNDKFPFIAALHDLLIESELIRKEDLLRRVRTAAGVVKLLTLSGIFLNDRARSVDMLIVGDTLKKKALEKTLTTIEAEIGTEIRYAVFSTKEFLYRLDMHDKLLRDVFDYPHHTLVDKVKKNVYLKK